MNTKSQERLAIQAATDNRHDLQPPLDFTFMCLTSVAECLDESPRWKNSKGEKKNIVKETKDAEKETKEKKKYKTNAIRLSNNVISDWTAFSTTVAELVEEPSNLEWIDLSFNDIKDIDKCILEYPNLKVLYLHGNGIEEVCQVEKLSKLTNLRTLTLHGNPIEDEAVGYRQYVISRLPQLRNFDFSTVTKQDRASAQTWSEMTRNKKKLKK
eukprot:gene6922-7700_t